MSQFSAGSAATETTNREAVPSSIYDPVDPACQPDPVLYYKALLAAPPVQVDRGLLTTLVSRYAQVVEVLRDHKRFSSIVPQGPGTERYPLFGAQNFTFTDPPVHTRLRRLVAPSFAPRKIEAQEQQVRVSLDQLYAEMESKGEVEFVSEFANRLPMMTVGKMLDWPEGEFDFLRGLVVYLFEQAKLKPGEPMPPAILKEFALQRDYFSRMIEARRRHPGQDVISSIVSAHDEKGAVSFEELLGLVTTIVLGGVPTTAELLTFLVYEMLNHPDQLELLLSNPDLAAGAVEETLRFDPPVTMTPRFALVDTEIGGVRIPAGTAVWPVMGAANRDPEQFKDPDIYDITRAPNDHLAFGEGVHFCIGNPTARLQGRLVAASIFHRFPRMRIVSGFIPTYRGTAMSRSMAQLRLQLR
ncbi:MAG: cytochrome P450 [Candidatus Binataceae bacterium]